MPRWTNIVCHHTATPEQTLPDVVAIRRFHTSYRQGGNIITATEFQQKKEAGEGGLVPPWKDIGYHWIVEKLSDNRPWVIQGRSMMDFGAHTVEQNMNRKGIGVAFVGNFDLAPPPEDLFEKGADLVAWLCRMYHIPLDNIAGHRDYASYKSCPGTKFDMIYFKERVSEYLKLWLPVPNGTAGEEK